MHPNLTSHLTSARTILTNIQSADYTPWMKGLAYKQAHGELCSALAIAKTLGLGAVVARVLLALREVGKASRALAVA